MQEIAKRQRSVHHKIPVDAFTRIEINDDPIRSFDVVDRGVPGMKLHRIHRDEAKQSGHGGTLG